MDSGSEGHRTLSSIDEVESTSKVHKEETEQPDAGSSGKMVQHSEGGAVEDGGDIYIDSEISYSMPEFGEDEDEFEVPIPYFQPEMSVFDMIKRRIVIPGVKEIILNDDHVNVIEKFITDDLTRLLVAYNTQHKGFNIDNVIPAFAVQHICFFFKATNAKEITSENFLREVQYGSIKGGHIESLLRLMMGIYAPIIFENSSWPDSIKNDFSATLHRFLASLTDARWKLQGKTVLYITSEGMKLPVQEAAKKKELVQRLETSIIHWARQIKEVLTTQDAYEMAENAGPLDEIEFWRNRCVDLSGITSQLEKPGVKHITQILELAKSSYVAPFLRLSSQIIDGSKQTESNLIFLNLLQEPCTELLTARVTNIPKMIPKILTVIRFIWVNSTYFNTRERLTGILKKLSNEIIRRCCAEIDLDKINDGYVVSGTKTLLQCIHCCDCWKDTYDNFARVHHRFSPVPWLLDQSSIFAQVDAFIQRCKDILKVCEAQSQFARYRDGYQAEMPYFAGVKGEEIVRGLLETETHFHKSFSHLFLHRKIILDVKATSWHDLYNRFQTEMKDLELMVQNIILTAFETVTTVAGSVELLDIFSHLSSRELIHQLIEKKTVSIYKLFNEEMNAVKRELTNKEQHWSPFLPKYAGFAYIAKLLKNRVHKCMNTLEQAHFLPNVQQGDETISQYRMLIAALDEYSQRTYNEWVATTPKEPNKLLDIRLMVRSTVIQPLIDTNFNRHLLKMLHEMYYWDKLKFDIPFAALEVFGKSEILKFMREHVLLVVKNYNKIITDLSTDERGLFKDKIRSLDKTIGTGLTTLTWASRGAVEYFINESLAQCSNIQEVVDIYKKANQSISLMCVEISELLLVKIDPKVVYKNLEFEADQAKHRESCLTKIKEIYSSIIVTLQQSYEMYKNDGQDVQISWYQHTEKMDSMLEEAFRLNVKWSLQLLSNAITGDGKSTLSPLFKVRVVLDGDKVDFSPTLVQLATIVDDIGRIHLFNTTADFERLPYVLTKKKQNIPSIFENLCADEEIKRIHNAINNGMQNNAQNLQTYLITWDSYREIWEINKDAFIRRYQKLNPQNSSFDADIARYTEVANSVQMQETILTIQFVLLDCSPLKSAVLAHCQEWQNKFTTLLSEIAITTLKELTNYMKSNSLKISRVPKTLDELVDSLQLWDRLETNLSSTEEKFSPLAEQFVILDKYEVVIPSEIKTMLHDLPNEWENFNFVLEESEVMLKKHKELFKDGLLMQAEELKGKIADLCKEFESTGPFSSSCAIDDALAEVETVHAEAEVLKEEEKRIHRGLAIFKIDHPSSRDLANLEKDLDSIKIVWDLTSEWKKCWDAWKVNTFMKLKTQVMEDTSTLLFKQLNKLSKQLKEKNWEIVENSKSKIDQFRRTMILINDLKNHAMRPRHWKQVQTDVQRTFDYTAESFTLEKIIEYKFDTYIEQISEVSQAATKELVIEQGLDAIAAKWEVVELDLIPYKDKGHFKLRSADEVFQNLDEHQIQLMTMKLSRFVKPFENEVDYWERTLSHILETIEVLLAVQRQWLYLENIFLGEDIRKQLPKETASFDNINKSWKEIMAQLFSDRFAKKGTLYPGVFEQLNAMNQDLSNIQKSLEVYLETKRQIFPRFYFLSNEDLFDIFGQSKNPEAIQPHIKKCFDSVKNVRIVKGGGHQKSEAAGMISLDSDYVEFGHSVLMDGAVESWMCDIEKAMRVTLKDLLRNCRGALKKNLSKRDKWIKDWPGQLSITASQIQWTQDVMKSLMLCSERGEMTALKSLKKKQVLILNKYSDAIRSSLSAIQRSKVTAMVTIEVHSRDIIERLFKENISDINAFEWLSQIRFYWEKDCDDCVIRQTNTSFLYCYEYLGNSGRLVSTPLTDRCYITLTTALYLHKGGNPKGPAGTGKTESIKDLGKALGMYVIVVNCCDGLDFKSMGKIFAGLAQTGAWGSFDEFSRINIETMSVIAQQIMCILNALSQNLEKFVFEGCQINLIQSCGIFMTMNPGYIGRNILPDSIIFMFRPIAMVVPDTVLIAEIFLFAEGFNNTKVLAKKTCTLINLASQQLSKQDHYNFDLRAIMAVLKYAGKKKRDSPDLSDEEALFLSMKDTNEAKLKTEDVPLFYGMLSDLFPGIEAPKTDYTKLQKAIEKELRDKNLQINDYTVTKVLQLFDTKSYHHAVMIVGATQSGKTTTWRVLQSSMTRMNRLNEPGYQLVKDYPLNPKALDIKEIYGGFYSGNHSFKDGVLSSIMRQACADEKPDEKWIVFDGPVDTLWVENMNSVMDDNRVLTLVSGERISLSEQVSLLFEAEDLSGASPATVSRASMVFCDYKNLGCIQYLESWLSLKTSKLLIEDLRKCIDKYLMKVLEFKNANCKELVPIAELNGIISLCRLFDALATIENGVDLSEAGYFTRIVHMWFQFCLIWSICCSVDEDGRKKIDNYIREMVGTFPNKDSVYEYFVDVPNRNWKHWEEQLKDGWMYNPSTPFFKLNVPTVDTIRYQFLCKTLVGAHCPVLMVGSVGTGKTMVMESTLASFNRAEYSLLTVNMSAQTTSDQVQNIIESRVEKRTKGVYVPIGSKKLISFIDDLNMPAKDTYGSQPPLELLRMWVEYGFWFDREKIVIKHINDMLLVSAMGPPGGGRMVISRRLQSRFNLINITFPQESQIKRIFGSMINQKLKGFEEEVKVLGDLMTQGTIEMYHAVVQRFLPTPARIHYLFNLRDISKVFQGLLRAEKNYHDTKPILIKLWIHECFRVFSDRLIDQPDAQAFVDILIEKLGVVFDQTYHNLCTNRVPPMFGNFMNPEEVYENIVSPEKVKIYMQEQLVNYNNTPGTVPMDLVFFKDAIDHISRIMRVIGQPRGNMLLIGICGSGRQSLTRMASFLCNYAVFQIEISKNYTKKEFRNDLKLLYFQAGVETKPTVFLFNDVQAVEETFYEDINNILCSGEVANLYQGDEFDEVKGALMETHKAEEVSGGDTQDIYHYFIDQVRANLHIVLCMSPVGETFRNNLRMFPAFVNCNTIDWFSEWPTEALLEVADKYLSEMDLRSGDPETIKPALVQMFMIMHKSIAEYSVMLLEEMRRHNYITPTNYLELVSGYKKLFCVKAEELINERDKLCNGLSKIIDTREKVEKMSVDLEVAKEEVAAYQKQCDEFLKILVQQKREADEQQKSVAMKSEKIKEEETKCQALADIAQADLNEAMPALEEAIKALESLNKKDMTEIKSYGRPPVLVEKVMEAVMILRGSEPTWTEAKKQLGDQNFLKQLMNFDKDNISDRVLRKIGGYVAQADFHPEIIGHVSLAAKSLCMWVRAMELYGRIYRVVEPKRLKLYAALSVLKEKQEALAEAKAKLAELEAKLIELKQLYDDKLAQKEELKRKAEYTEMMLDRAQKLVLGLASEHVVWMETVKNLEERISHLIGDVLIASGFLSYLGPFLANYRISIVESWKKEMTELKIDYERSFNFCTFMTKPTLVREWRIQGLPSDDFSTENGIIITRGSRWPLMVDPQGQALKWIKHMEANEDLQITDLQSYDYLHKVERAVQLGLPLLLQNVYEELDPSLNPVLNMSLIKKAGGSVVMKFVDKEVEYCDDFRFYITTKLSNPHFSPEISSKVTVVNFTLTQKGLEAQLLGIVVRKEKPELEEQKDNLVCSIAAGKKKLVQCEDEILRLLNETKGSLLDDAQLVNTLQLSKTTYQEVTDSLTVSEQMEAKIDAAREGYRPCADQASLLFFVLIDLGNIDPMYQFSLNSYINLFVLSIEKSQRVLRLEERINNLNDYHIYSVYKYTCRGLFEKHKLLFSFQMCIKILERAKKLSMDEYSFFLRGGIVTDRENQMDNPNPIWISHETWDNITELDKLTNFHGLCTSFEQYSRDWYLWYTSSEPENTSLPAEWDNTLSELQHMLIVRSLRPDRVSLCATSFIINNLGAKFTEPPALDISIALEDSTEKTPLIFVLSPGVDPLYSVVQLSETCGMTHKFNTLSLGQGQAPVAAKLIKSALNEGKWIFLANCHLLMSWMPHLSQIVDRLQTENPNPNFRLWLSSHPHPDFPISILQTGIKMIIEPPKGLKAGMRHLYNLVNEQQFHWCHKPEKYKKLLFALCFFHTILVERKKFRMLGWNVMYQFNESDFEISEKLLTVYLDGYEETQWEALRYLIASINYGGHVTDEWDRRLLMTYINDYICESILAVPFYKFSSLLAYYVPKDGPLSSYKEYVTMLPNIDLPEVFGQHPNADISSQMQETKVLFDSLLSLQPHVSSAGGESREDKVLEMSASISKQLPENMDYDGTAKILSVEPSPLNTVLLQEMQHYNILLNDIRESLSALEEGIKGLVVMTAELEIIFNCIFDGRLPPLWEKAYPSTKPLAAWARDLVQRVDLFAKWASIARPPWVFTISAFIFPRGLLTAVLQIAARQHQVPVDMLTWEFIVMTVDDSNLTGPAKDGIYVKGLFLQGAGWDKKNAVLTEAKPMELICPMPTIQFKPVEGKKKDVYTAPCYYYPNRGSNMNYTSFVVAVDLRAGDKPGEHWTKRGTALLMSLDY